jgi:fumarylacetoacetase
MALAKAQKSFIDVPEDSDFPIQNLPYGVFHDQNNLQARIGVAIGDMVLDLAILEKEGLLPVNTQETIFNNNSLNKFMSLGKETCGMVREKLIELLSDENPLLRDNNELRNKALISATKVTMQMPVEITGYTDFYSSEEHAKNIGKLFRSETEALLPNWKHVPVAYNGRASSIVISGTPIHRPMGQIKPFSDKSPIYAASTKLDFELEVGFFIGQGNSFGKPIPISNTDKHIFGFVLVNDWSARDIQQWEYQPLGPFLGKIFATSISPWVVPIEALEPFKLEMPIQDPIPVEYLQQSSRYIYDINLEVKLKPFKSENSFTLCKSNYKHLYWSINQQLAHHTITGCNMRTGDLLASGSISGLTKNAIGSLVEQTSNGKNPLQLPNGESRTFLEDGDEITMLAWGQTDNNYRVGFGKLSGLIRPAFF